MEMRNLMFLRYRGMIHCMGQLISKSKGYSDYTQTLFCDFDAGNNFLAVRAGGGGRSACATGVPTVPRTESGTCKGWPKPSWQQGVFNTYPADDVRRVPDVSLFASSGSAWGHVLAFCFSDSANNGNAPCTSGTTPGGGYGTSAAAPAMAGIQALVDQKMGARQGLPNIAYYELAALEYVWGNFNPDCNSSLGVNVDSSCTFHDVTEGDILVDCRGKVDCDLCWYQCPPWKEGSYGLPTRQILPHRPAEKSYGAVPGWDFATGIGTVNAYNLVMHWQTVMKMDTTLVTPPLRGVAQLPHQRFTKLERQRHYLPDLLKGLHRAN